jgi:flagellar biosynthesis protein FlhG
MLDQAHDLRRLATEHCRPKAACMAGRPRLLAVAGGKGGVGATTAAIELAEKLTRAGWRTLLVDADPRGGDVAMRCGVEERYSLADLLAGRRDLADVIESTASGVQVVAGAPWADDTGRSPAACRLIDLLAAAGTHADVVVVDLGNNGAAVRPVCEAADAIVMVTTSEPAAVLSTFTAIKRLTRYASSAAASQPFALHVLVDNGKNNRAATIAQHRLATACRRLLGVDIVFTSPDTKPRPAVAA